MAPGYHLTEDIVQRNPHPDFKLVEGSRPAWRHMDSLNYTKTRRPDWKYGDGANDGGVNLEKKHTEIDPYMEGRQRHLNYKLLTSAVIPRPIGFISTRSKNGTLNIVLLNTLLNLARLC
jgi:hypothetical protein